MKLLGEEDDDDYDDEDGSNNEGEQSTKKFEIIGLDDSDEGANEHETVSRHTIFKENFSFGTRNDPNN